MNTALQLFSFCPITLWLPVTCLKGNTMRFAVILHTKFPVAPLDQCFSNGGTLPLVASRGSTGGPSSYLIIKTFFINQS